jgi:hypothetical protein
LQLLTNFKFQSNESKTSYSISRPNFILSLVSNSLLNASKITQKRAISRAFHYLFYGC